MSVLMTPPVGFPAGATVESIGGSPVPGPDAKGRYTISDPETTAVLLKNGWTIEPAFAGSTALGGGAAPTLGTIGGSGPTTAAQNSWLQLRDNAGNAFWIPVWK